MGSIDTIWRVILGGANQSTSTQCYANDVHDEWIRESVCLHQSCCDSKNTGINGVKSLNFHL